MKSNEVIGRQGISDRNYNEYLLSRLRPDQLNVLTIHAEVEGLSRSALFEDFLKSARSQDARFVPLSDLIPASETLPDGRIVPGPVAGREGWVAWQE